jgi:glutathione-regulated potassium-efflux system ancillary protein KefC/glutathione-regulated potassium-efflux system protein KefB
MEKALVDVLVVVVSLSLVATPLLIFLNERVFHLGQREEPQREFDRIEERDNRVIIAGFGRVGQMVARTLRMRKIPFTALEANWEQVDFVRRFGNKIYFGDATRLEVLQAAHAERAQVLVLAIGNVEASVKVAELVRKHFPHLKIYARSRNRQHVYRLRDLGIEHTFRETLPSSLEMADDVLQALGLSAHQARETVTKFREHDEALLQQQYLVHHDTEQLIATAKQAADQLEHLFEQDTSLVEEHTDPGDRHGA